MILLSAGHNPSSPGACYPADNPDWCEHQIAVDWVNRMVVRIRQQMSVMVAPAGPLGYKIAWVNEQCERTRVQLAVELHFNSDASLKAKGSETLYCPGSVRGEMLATIVQGAMASIFPPNRGIKEGWYRMVRPPNPEAKPDAFLSRAHCPALIIEPEFMYNRTVIEVNRDIACDVIADAILEAARHA